MSFIERLSSLRRLKCTSIIEKGPKSVSFIERFFVLCPLFRGSTVYTHMYLLGCGCDDLRCRAVIDVHCTLSLTKWSTYCNIWINEREEKNIDSCKGRRWLLCSHSTRGIDHTHPENWAEPTQYMYKHMKWWCLPYHADTSTEKRGEEKQIHAKEEGIIFHVDKQGSTRRRLFLVFSNSPSKPSPVMSPSEAMAWPNRE